MRPTNSLTACQRVLVGYPLQISLIDHPHIRLDHTQIKGDNQFTILISGAIIPNMGKTNSISLSDALFSGVQQKVLGLLFGHPDRSFYSNEIARLGKTGNGSLQRELARLTASGLVEMTVIGRQKHYQANHKSVLYQEIRLITLKTFGLADVLRDALQSHLSKIRYAFIFGSIAKGTDSTDSDIDVMVIADGLGYSELFESLTKAESLLGRKVSPTLYAPADFLRKKNNDNHFVTRVLEQPKIDLLGEEDAIESGKPAEPAEDRPAQSGAPGSA